MSLVAIIPALHEPLIGSTVKQVRVRVDRVLVVVEAHDDETGTAATRAGADVLCSSYGCLAGAVALGVEYTGPDDDVVTLDGDGANPPYQIGWLLRTPGDVVVGSRFLPMSQFVATWERRWRSRLFSTACRAASGIPLRDWGGGLRLFRDGAAKAAFPTETRGHAYQAEALWRAHRAGCGLIETPVTYLPTHSTLSRGDVLEVGGLLARMAADRL